MANVQYQWEKFITENKPIKKINEWDSSFGPVITEREKGLAKKVKFNLLIDNPKIKVYIVGNFNSWGKDNLDEYELIHDEYSVFAGIELSDKDIKHKEPYKFLIKNDKKDRILQDPAGHYFDEQGNTIFWDFEDPSSYKQKHGLIDTVNRSTKILQTDLPGLIVHFSDKKGVCAKDIALNDYYKFITESGVLKHIKDLGFNTIQFLPFAQSIDGDNWKFRYLVPFQFAVQRLWGNPDEFARMIDECHKLGIAVIGDFVIGHLPHKDYKLFGGSFLDNGIWQWINRHGTNIYMKEETPWGTTRTDFDNQYVRAFIVSSCLHFMKRYKIDGYRIDNVDGIIRYGPNGDGDERPKGRIFLRELNKTIYEYNPHALIHFESHYFYKDNAKMLVVPFENDNRALGATCYNSSRMTYYFHVDYMIKDAKKITPWKFRDITSEKEWGQSNSTIADFHNHDAAAGLIVNRCTGSYAYDAMTCKQPHNHFHAVGKVKVMEAIISFAAEGRTLDLIQSFLLQTGTFEHDSSIQWQLTFNEANHNMLEYKKEVNNLMDDPAFWPMFTKNRKFLNVDDTNKIMVIERSADFKGKKTRYVIVVNLSSWLHHNYKVGVTTKKDYKVALNADKFVYTGTGMASYPDILKNNPSKNFEVLDQELVLPILAPYGVLVLKEV